MTFLIVILSLIGAIIILGLIMPKHYSVTTYTTINRPKDQVNEYVRMFANQIDYSEWLKADPEIQPEIIGTDGAIGTIYRWESTNSDRKKNVGKGEQEIMGFDADKIDIQLRFIAPMAGVCKLEHFFEAITPTQTLYTCTFSAEAKFPKNVPAILIGKGFIKKAQLQTMNNAKAILESQ